MEKRIAVVCGGSKGIGKALVERLVIENEYDVIFSVSRTKSENDVNKIVQGSKCSLIEVLCDVESPHDVQALCATIQSHTKHVHLLVSTVGFLWNDNFMPEKNIREVNQEQLLLSIQRNTWPALSLVQNLLPVLRHKEELRMVFFSARVGSISDNHLGGWYSYRISKAALNMAIKNISIEFGRRNPNLCCIGYHPGTVDTNLSSPFTKRYTKNPIFSTEQAAKYFYSVLRNRTPEENGMCFDWKGTRIDF